MGASWHFFDLDLKRGYQTGSDSAQSQGSTDAQALSLFGRVGWAFPVAENITVEPFAQYNWQQLRIDGYTESDGSFRPILAPEPSISTRRVSALKCNMPMTKIRTSGPGLAWDF
ncbi:autotransporter outer membrane beta-barrel domain-containing protein [Pseudodesulfovibrio sp.]|uniref:autotransporter outer membrane beta-barrel domain-containing protein n=1 Tax=unclassified Pseudodesulfovibrio TaxID=2661612 RepID=UPI003B009A8F